MLNSNIIYSAGVS